MSSLVKITSCGVGASASLVRILSALCSYFLFFFVFLFFVLFFFCWSFSLMCLNSHDFNYHLCVKVLKLNQHLKLCLDLIFGYQEKHCRVTITRLYSVFPASLPKLVSVQYFLIQKLTQLSMKSPFAFITPSSQIVSILVNLVALIWVHIKPTHFSVLSLTSLLLSLSHCLLLPLPAYSNSVFAVSFHPYSDLFLPCSDLFFTEGTAKF